VTRIRRLVPLLVLLVVVAGCAGSPPARVYVLGDPPNPPPGISTLSGRPVMRVLPVAVPDYLDTRDIVIRSGQNEVKASPTGRWAERLSVGLTHALAAALASRVPDADTVVGPPSGRPAEQVMVDVEIFEIRPDGRCLLTARWTLSSGDNGRVAHSGRGTFVEQAADTGDGAIASAMTRSIGRLAEQIAVDSGVALSAAERPSAGQPARP
jgi:uncharacterized lipoprotein YmbA